MLIFFNDTSQDIDSYIKPEGVSTQTDNVNLDSYVRRVPPCEKNGNVEWYSITPLFK